MENIAKDLEIREGSLSKECISQAALYWSYGESLSKAKKELQRITDILTLKKSELDTLYREQLEGTKYTEAVITSLIIQNKEYQALREELRQVEYVVNTYEVAIKALTQKKDMLDNLVRLQVNGIYAQNDIRSKLNEQK